MILNHFRALNQFVLFLLLVVVVGLGYYASRPWTWGLMDEPGIAMSAQSFNNVATFHEKMHMLFPAWRPSDTGGRFRPLYSVYSISRFVLFNSATVQHGIQLAMILAIVILWVLFLHQLRQNTLVIGIGALCAFYFGPMTVAGINFLSIQELPVLLLISIAIVLANKNRLHPSAYGAFGIFICVGFAMLLKETAFCLIPAILLAWIHPNLRRWEIVVIVVLCLICVLYPAVMYVFVRGGYSSSYQMTSSILFSNGLHVLRNLIWSYKFAIPFLILGVPLHWKRNTFDRLDAVSLAGILAYGGVLLPWTSEITYYHAPLGPFVGFLTARGVVTLLEARPPWVARLMKGAFVVSSLLMTFSILRQVRGVYEFNAGQQAVQSFLISNLKSEHVYINGAEASETMAQGMSLRTGRHYARFNFAYPDTFVQAPAFVVLIGGQSRYRPPTLPANAMKVLEHGRWQIFQVA